MRVALRIYETFRLSHHGYFDRKFRIGVASRNGKVLSKGITPFIAPLQGVARKRAHAACGGVWGQLAQACSKRRGESANPNGFCA